MSPDDDWRPMLRALIEALLAFDHPAFPAITVEQVERRVLEYFPLTTERGAPLRAGLAAVDVGFAAAPLADRRATLRRWARGDVHAQRRFYTGVKAMVMIAAYSLPELRQAVGYEADG
jgi:hypothetical protein